MAGKGVAGVIMLFLCVLMDRTVTAGKNIWNDLALPVEHLPYYFYSHGDTKRMCLDDPSCPYKVSKTFIGIASESVMELYLCVVKYFCMYCYNNTKQLKTC